MPNSTHTPLCDDIVPVLGEIIVLKAKLAALESWRIGTETVLKEIRAIISQVKLLMSLSIGGDGLSTLTLILTLIVLVTGTK